LAVAKNAKPASEQAHAGLSFGDCLTMLAPFGDCLTSFGVPQVGGLKGKKPYAAHRFFIYTFVLKQALHLL